MNLAECINNQLEGAPCEKESEVLAVDDELRVYLKLADCDRLGCLLEKLNLEQTKDGRVAFDPVRIAAKVTYLGERLAVIETEGRKGRTILRSCPPRTDGEAIGFFEMVLDQSMGLSLERYTYDARMGTRKRVATPLTRDFLDRLIRDLIELARAN